MTAQTFLQYLKALEPALPLSPVKEKGGSFKRMTNSDLRRCCEQKSVLVNGEHIEPFEPVDFPVFSLVFFPKSSSRRTTLI